MATSPVPTTMRAHLLESFNAPYALREVSVPTITHPNDILIRVDAASYCHTDAVLAAGILSPPPLPFIGCHEFAGTVVALPSEAGTRHSFGVGDRVAVPGRGYHVCGKCIECMHPSGPDPDDPGFSVYCPTAGGGLGINWPGGFSEYAIVDSKQIALIPPEMTAEEVAPLMCAGLTVFAALRKCELQPGQRVGIIGCGGGLGHLGLQFATGMGLKTLGVDVTPQALQLAKDLQTGAEIVHSAEENADTLRRKMGEEDGSVHFSEMGLDAVLILPESQKSFDFGVSLLKNGGMAVVVSFPPQGFNISAADLVFRRINVVGTLIGSNRALIDMLHFCVKHDVKAKMKIFPFEKLNDLVKESHSGGGGKLVLSMSQ